jgi:hypothetical protein
VRKPERTQVILGSVGAFVAFTGIAVKAAGAGGLLVAVVAVAPFALYVLFLRGPLATWVVGFLLLGLTLAIYVQVSQSSSSTIGLRLLGTVPNNFALVGTAIAIDGAIRYARNIPTSGRTWLLHVGSPLVIGAAAWLAVGEAQSHPSPWLTIGFWLPVLLAAIILGALASSYEVRHLGHLLMAVPVLVAVIRAVASPEGDLVALPVRVLPYVGGGFLLGLAAWAMAAMARWVRRARSTPPEGLPHSQAQGA